jgi:hypothetical protein
MEVPISNRLALTSRESINGLSDTNVKVDAITFIIPRPSSHGQRLERLRIMEGEHDERSTIEEKEQHEQQGTRSG